MTHLIPVGLAALALAFVADAPTWTTTLTPTDGSTLAGSATVAPASASPTAAGQRPAPPTRYLATISITGAKPRATLAWRVQEGKCGSAGTVVGAETDYPAITSDDRGGGTARATVSAELVEQKAYSVVLQGAGAPTASACGDLAASPTGASGR